MEQYSVLPLLVRILQFFCVCRLQSDKPSSCEFNLQDGVCVVCQPTLMSMLFYYSALLAHLDSWPKKSLFIAPIFFLPLMFNLRSSPQGASSILLFTTFVLLDMQPMVAALEFAVVQILRQLKYLSVILYFIHQYLNIAYLLINTVLHK